MRLPQRQFGKQKKVEKHYLDNAFEDGSPYQKQYLLKLKQDNPQQAKALKKEIRQQRQHIEKMRAEQMRRE